MEESNPELEPNAPDWSNEPASDELLAEQLQEKGTNMSEVQDPNPNPGVGPAPTEDPNAPGTPMPDTTPPEETPSEEGDPNEGERYEGGEIPNVTPSEEQEDAPPEPPAAG